MEPQEKETLETKIWELRAKLAAKKLKVIQQTSSIPKLGHNDYSNYDYATAADTFDIVRKALAVGLSFTAEVESSETSIPKEGSKNILTKIWMRYTLTDTETGYAESVKWPGEAWDTGDKGLYKAKTNALKYFCFQTFLLPTGIDVETDSPEQSAPPPPKDRYHGRRSGQDFYAGQGKQPPKPDKPPIEDQIVEGLLGPQEDLPPAEKEISIPAVPQASMKIMAGLADYYKAKIAEMEGYKFSEQKFLAAVWLVKPGTWPTTAVGATKVKSIVKPQDVADAA